MNNMLSGKTALITGAARGIGKAIALKFASEGANIAFTDLVLNDDMAAGLEATRRGGISADGEGRTTREGIFAGGDAVTGAATVILAMGAGRKAAKAIDEYLKTK